MLDEHEVADTSDDEPATTAANQLPETDVPDIREAAVPDVSEAPALADRRRVPAVTKQSAPSGGRRTFSPRSGNGPVQTKTRSQETNELHDWHAYDDV